MMEVFVIAPIRVHRESLSTALSNIESLSVVGTAATVAEALPHLRDLGPDVAVLDAPMPEDLDFPATMTAEPEVKLLAVGVREDEAVDWIQAGVIGCVPRDASPEDVAVAVASVARGEVITAPAFQAHILRHIRRFAAEALGAAGEARLTPRQNEVLDLVAEELSNKQIARRLSIQEQTVKNHIHNILVRLRVHSRREAAARVKRRARRFRVSK